LSIDEELTKPPVLHSETRVVRTVRSFNESKNEANNNNNNNKNNNTNNHANTDINVGPFKRVNETINFDESSSC
jgi:hypothetical protein